VKSSPLISPSVSGRASRYNSLSSTHRESFGFKEDLLISIVLHNLLVYMLMMGLRPQRTMELIQSFAARSRLAIGEERLLQQTLKHIEACVEKNVRKLGGEGRGWRGCCSLILV